MALYLVGASWLDMILMKPRQDWFSQSVLPMAQPQPTITGTDFRRTRIVAALAGPFLEFELTIYPTASAVVSRSPRTGGGRHATENLY